MFSGLESVGAISIACLEYCSALASTCMASGALDFQLRGSVCPISASVDTSFGVNAISFSPTSCIFCMFPTCTYAKVNAPYTGDLYRLSGYFRINASPSSIFLAASFGVTAKKALYAASSSAFTGAGASSVRGVTSGVFGLSLCCAGGWLWLPWPYCEACAAAIPLPHASSPATVAAPNQIFQFFLIRFLLFPSCFTQNRPMFTAALWVYLRQTPRALFAPLVLPAPARLPRSARTDTPFSPLRDSPHHRKSARGKRATTPAPWDLESPHVHRRSGARIPAWLLPHRDPGAPPIQFRTTPAPDPDISSELFEMKI